MNSYRSGQAIGAATGAVPGMTGAMGMGGQGQQPLPVQPQPTQPQPQTVQPMQPQPQAPPQVQAQEKSE